MLQGVKNIFRLFGRNISGPGWSRIRGVSFYCKSKCFPDECQLRPEGGGLLGQLVQAGAPVVLTGRLHPDLHGLQLGAGPLVGQPQPLELVPDMC